MSQEFVESSIDIHRIDLVESSCSAENWQKEIDTMDWESPAQCRAFPGTVIEYETVFVECSGR